MMSNFWIFAGLLCVLAAGFIAMPYWLASRKVAGPARQEDRAALNVAIFEERSAELQASLAVGDLTEAEYEQLNLELQRNLLDESSAGNGDDNGNSTNESGGQPALAEPGAAPARLPLVLALLVPVLAIIAYSDFGLAWGAIGDVELAAELRAAGATPGGAAAPAAGPSPHDRTGVDASVAKLAERLQSQPDNDEGWFLLSQSYMRMAEFEKGAAAFKHLLDRYPQDAGLASWYTEALFLADDRQMTPRVTAAIGRTLKMNPMDISMLEIKAMDAFQKNDMQGALDWFRRALGAGAEGERADLILQAVNRIEADLGMALTEAGSALPPMAPGMSAGPAAIASVPASQSAAGVKQRSLQVLVRLDPAVQADPGARVFVFARAMQGPPMPLAVQQMTVADLPKQITLDESMAMMAGMGLANFDQVQVGARISSSGIANVSPDDYQALSAGIDLTAKTPLIELVLATKVKDQ
jgi:cytochrome c-type biogenesis protein CcmH